MVTVTFQPTARQKAQLVWACAQAGIPLQPGEVAGTVCIEFESPVEWIAWYQAFQLDYAWSPLDIKVAEQP